MGDTAWVNEQLGMGDAPGSWRGAMVGTVVSEYGLFSGGQSLRAAWPAHLPFNRVAASGMIDFLAAVRAIRDEQCDIALAGMPKHFTPCSRPAFTR